jgi:hypothetical protein
MPKENFHYRPTPEEREALVRSIEANSEGLRERTFTAVCDVINAVERVETPLGVGAQLIILATAAAELIRADSDDQEIRADAWDTAARALRKVRQVAAAANIPGRLTDYRMPVPASPANALTPAADPAP